MEEPFRNISDTARWVAVYRAIESERPDAWFRDPLAKRLAGERGECNGTGHDGMKTNPDHLVFSFTRFC